MVAVFGKTQRDASLIGDNDVFIASGAKGQFIWVIPFLNMVVVSTAGQPARLNRYGNMMGAFISEPILWEYIIPACMKNGGQK